MNIASERNRIHSIGHSNRKLNEFITALKAHRIETLADVRSYPVSKRYPYFAREALAEELSARGIRYAWMPALGGRREGGYEAYTMTAEFAEALAALAEAASVSRTAFMCSEMKWRECHRAFVADALARSGWEVVHIYGVGETEMHSALPLL